MYEAIVLLSRLLCAAMVNRLEALKQEDSIVLREVSYLQPASLARTKLCAAASAYSSLLQFQLHREQAPPVPTFDDRHSFRSTSVALLL